MCPDCGQAWALTDMREAYDFGSEQHVTTGSWVPVDDASDTQHGSWLLVVEDDALESLSIPERDQEVARRAAGALPAEYKDWIWRSVTATGTATGGTRTFEVHFAPRRA